MHPFFMLSSFLEYIEYFIALSCGPLYVRSVNYSVSSYTDDFTELSLFFFVT